MARQRGASARARKAGKVAAPVCAACSRRRAARCGRLRSAPRAEARGASCREGGASRRGRKARRGEASASRRWRGESRSVLTPGEPRAPRRGGVAERTRGAAAARGSGRTRSEPCLGLAPTHVFKQHEINDQLAPLILSTYSMRRCGELTDQLGTLAGQLGALAGQLGLHADQLSAVDGARAFFQRLSADGFETRWPTCSRWPRSRCALCYSGWPIP